MADQKEKTIPLAWGRAVTVCLFLSILIGSIAKFNKMAKLYRTRPVMEGQFLTVGVETPNFSWKSPT